MLHYLRDEGQLTDWNQIAFLFRSVKNDRPVGLARFLEARKIPVYSPRSNQFFEREEVRLMLGALILIFPQFPEVREKGWRGQTPPGVWAYYDDDCVRLFLGEPKKPENRDLFEWIRRKARRHAPFIENVDYAFSDLFYELLSFPLFSRYLGDMALGGVRDSRPARNLARLSRLLTKFEYLHNVKVLTTDFLEGNLQALFNTYLRFLHDGSSASARGTPRPRRRAASNWGRTRMCSLSRTAWRRMPSPRR